MDEIKLDKNTLIQLGNSLFDVLHEVNVTKDCQLIINVDNVSFKKIDEDIYYRDNKDENKNFEPSENEIVLKFHNLKIIIRKED